MTARRLVCRSSQWIEREALRPVAFAVSDGEYRPVTRAGWIGRNEGYKLTPSASWRIVGAVTLNNFGYVTRRYSLAELLADPSGIPWHHKNGSQKTFIMDFDHGSIRQWCRPSHRMLKA